MPAQITSTIDNMSVPVAAALLGIRGASRSGVLRTCLALFHGKEPLEAIRYANTSARPDKAGRERANFTIPDELKITDDTNTSWAVRVGLGLAMGLTREQAEHYACVELGRPRKTT